MRVLRSREGVILAWPCFLLAPRKLFMCFAGDCAGTGPSEARVKELEAALHDAELGRRQAELGRRQEELAKLGAYVLDLWRLTFCLCRENMGDMMGLSSPPPSPLLCTCCFLRPVHHASDRTRDQEFPA